MNIKKTFLQLTQYTYPYGTEHLLKKFLPKDVQKDTFGNYYLQIENQRGRCDKIFTSHLDTASEKYQKVQHVFENNLVSAKNSILGAGLGTTFKNVRCSQLTDQEWKFSLEQP